MNKNVIQKCIEELKKPKPNKQYVLGMLEAMCEMGGSGGSEIKETVHPSFGATGGYVAPTGSAGVTAPSAVNRVEKDPEGELETPEERKVRLSNKKVPPVFLGNISKMHLDPSKTDGTTDITPTH